MMEHGSVNSTSRFATMGPLDLFVDGDNGDDNNVGTTQATALATWAEAERRIPFVVNHLVRVHFANAAAGYVATTLRSRVLNQPVLLFVDDDWDATVYTDVDTGTTAAGTDATQIVDSVGGFATDAYRNLWLTLDDGAAVSHRKLVRNSTATTLVPAAQFSVAPGVGDTWRTFQNAVGVSVDTLPSGDDTTFLLAGTCAGTDAFSGASTAPGRYVLIGFNFTSADPNNRFVSVAGSVVFYGCVVQPRVLDAPHSAEVRMGFDQDDGATAFNLIPFAHLDAALGCVSKSAWGGWGCVWGNAEVMRIRQVESYVAGYWGVADTLGGTTGGMNCTESFGGTISHYGGSTSRAIPSLHGSFIGGKLPGGIGPRYQAGNNTNPLIVGTVNNGNGNWFIELVTGEVLGTNRGITVRGGGTIQIHTGVTGQNASGSSLHVQGGARGYVVDAPNFGDAAAADYDCDNGAPQNKAFFAAFGDAMVNLATLGAITRIG